MSSAPFIESSEELLEILRLEWSPSVWSVPIFSLMMMMLLLLMMMMVMGDKVLHFYIYKLPIVRFSGCYWYK